MSDQVEKDEHGLEPRHYQFQPVAAFREFLETMIITHGYHGGDDSELVMYCKTCGVGPDLGICNVEDGDDLAILVQTGLAHECR